MISCRQAYDRVVANVTPKTATFANTILPVAHAENVWIQGTRGLNFYVSVSPDAGVREASREVRCIFDAFVTETAMREDLCALIKAVIEQRDKNLEHIDPESQYFLKKLHEEYVSNGMELPAGPIRNRFQETKGRIQYLAELFVKNVAEAKSFIWLTRQELDGLPEGILDELEEGEGANLGKFRVDFGCRAFRSILANAKNEETRRRVQVASSNTCNINGPIFKEVVILRDKAARMLGYPNNAALSIGKRMAQTSERVNSFLADLVARLELDGKARIERLKQAKREEVESRGEAFDGRFFAWDYDYYDNFVGEARLPAGLGHAMFSDYFVLQHTVSTILRVFGHIFGLHFIELGESDRDSLSPTGSGSDLVWDEEVRMFSVWDIDQDESFLGYLYLDLDDREGKGGKYHSCNIIPVCLPTLPHSHAPKVQVPLTPPRVSPRKTAVGNIQQQLWCVVFPSHSPTSRASLPTTRLSYCSMNWAMVSTISYQRPSTLAFMALTAHLLTTARHPAKCSRTGAGFHHNLRL